MVPKLGIKYGLILLGLFEVKLPELRLVGLLEHLVEVGEVAGACHQHGAVPVDPPGVEKCGSWRGGVRMSPVPVLYSHVSSLSPTCPCPLPVATRI